MNPVIRAFIAIELSPEIHQKLDEVISHLNIELKDVSIRWVRSENIHLTLKFLGDVSISNLDILEKMLVVEVVGHDPFEISVGDLGAFPNNRRPRLIWVGVNAPPELSLVQHGIELQMDKLGYAREERPFSPHLTLGRVARSANSKDLIQISQLLERYKVGFLGATRVSTIHLFKSDLKPTGAVYTNIFSAPLKIV